MKEIYELKGAGRSIREIARELEVSRNTVRRYLQSPEAMRPKARPPRGSKLDPYTEYIDGRMAAETRYTYRLKAMINDN